MKTKEILVEYSLGDLGNSIKGNMYTNLGIGGPEANEIVAQKNFVKRFVKQIELSKKSKVTNIPQMITSYMTQYGWTASPEQEKDLMALAQTAGTDPRAAKQLAIDMWQIGQQQMRDPRTGAVLSDKAKAGKSDGTTQPGMGLDGKPEELDGPTQQVLKLINRMNNKDHLDDLHRIILTAMQVLYGASPQQYAQLYKDIMSGGGKKKPTKQVTKRASPSTPANKAGAGAFGNMASELSKYAPTPSDTVSLPNGQKRLNGPDVIDDPSLTRIKSPSPELGYAGK